MKRCTLLLFAVVITAMAMAQTKNSGVAMFNSLTIDLGNVKLGKPATAIFEITNIGKKPLLIEQANPTCGCTITDYTKTSILPSEKGMVKAIYNAANMGSFRKTIAVKFTGIDETQAITSNGEVVAPNKE